MSKPLSPTQIDIVEKDGNLIVRASAGTGKTHTMVSKIERDISLNHSHKVIAALTFTIKAANEIRDRLIVTTDDHFVGTNNSFAIEEIIKPFMKDVYGQDYDIDMGTDYYAKVDCFETGVDMIRERGIIGSYYDSKQNFVFQLALCIAKESSACREYLKAKYFKVFVDEYQDCDKDMHEFFMYICDVLGIETFVVGDEKQSIYMWRGAYPQAFKSIWDKPNFGHKYLRENFRSCSAIQNYSNILCEETRHLFNPNSDVSPIVLLCTNQAAWAHEVLKRLDPKKRSAVLRHKHDDVKNAAESLSTELMTFTYIKNPPIADITTNTAWLYNAIANYLIVETYSIYDFIQIIPEQIVEIKKLNKELSRFLNNLRNACDYQDKVKFANEVKAVATYFGYETREEHIFKLYETITNESFYNYFYQNDIQNIAITYLASKGLEFDQVVIFAEDYPLDKLESINNHYVASTRAKERLIIVYLYGSNDELYAKNMSDIFKKAKVEAKDVMTIVNCNG